MLLSDTEKMKLELSSTVGEAVVRISGVIDEDVNLGLVLSALSGISPAPARLVFDLGKVTRINSCGVREWISLLKKIPETIQLVFENVSAEFVEQANPIPDVLGRGRGVVRSFEAPYFCEKCCKTSLKLLQPGQVAMGGEMPVPPQLSCESCSSALKFDGFPEEYFYFLKWAKVG